MQNLSETGLSEWIWKKSNDALDYVVKQKIDKELYVALERFYDVDVSLLWIIMAIIMISLMIIAAPSIPGVGVMGYTILFSKLGIPAEGLVFASAVEVISDFGNTGFSVFCQMCLMAYMAKPEEEAVQGSKIGGQNENN